MYKPLLIAGCAAVSLFASPTELVVGNVTGGVGVIEDSWFMTGSNVVTTPGVYTPFDSFVIRPDISPELFIRTQNQG